MRSFVLVILSAIVLGGLFMGYWSMQPTTPAASIVPRAETVPPPPSAHDPAYSGIHNSEFGWMFEYDDRGQVKTAFKGEHFLPKPDGTVDVTNPVARFFLANHQHLEIHGDTGNVVLKGAIGDQSSGLMSGGALSVVPTRGRLDHVVLTLVDEITNKITLTMRTRNAVFDNETYCITTEGYREDNGQVITGDQVPVHVTGPIRMEGRGLTVRWNDRDGRLELLEVQHGDVLIINDPSNFSLGGSPKNSKGKALPTAWDSHSPLPQMLASKDRQAAGDVVTSFQRPQNKTRRATTQRAAHGSNVPVVYQATFYDHVRITQPDPAGTHDQIVIDNADRMDVDFLLKQSGGSAATQPSTHPAQAAATAPAAPAEGPTPAPTPQAAASPPAATQPAQREPPVYVHWTGVLRITPLQSAPPVPLKSGDAAVTLVGAPVQIHREEPKQQGTDDIRAASVLYLTDGEKVWLGRSPQIPQILINKFPPRSAKEQTPTRLVSGGTVQYSRVDAKTIMTGPGQGEIPIEPDPKNPHPLLQAAWSKRAEFDFTQSDSDKQQPKLRFGRFEGDVDIRHPRMALQSQALDLLFNTTGAPVVSAATPAGRKKSQSQPDLRQAIATGDVWCQLIDTAGKTQTIESDRLVLDTDQSAGKLYARHVNATGTVHVYGDDDLRAHYLDLLLKPTQVARTARPTTRKSTDDTAQVELEKMIARDDVVARSKDGSTATGDTLVVTTVNGKQHTVLTSRLQARVTDLKGNVVAGPEIQFDSGDGKAHVIGPGSMHAIQPAASTTQPATPVDVTWATGAEFDGAQNRIDAFGSVLAVSVDKRGVVDEATGEHVHIDLRTKPARPTTQPITAAAVQPGTKSTRRKESTIAGGTDVDLFKDKEVVAMTITDKADKAVLKSTQKGSDGGIEQQFVLMGPQIIVNQVPSRSLTVPYPGKMLSRDHRSQQRAKGADDQSGGSRGATAFEWHKSLVYSEATRRADMLGHVVVVHQDEDPRQPQVRLDAEHVIAFFEPAPPRKPGTQPAKGQDDAAQGQMQLKYLKALMGDQPVVVTRDISQLIAREVDYDPKQQLLIATGDPAVFYHNPTQRTRANRIEWETTTWTPRFSGAIMDSRPPEPVTQQPKAAKGSIDQSKLLKRSNTQ